MTSLFDLGSFAGHRLIGRKFKYYIRENPCGFWEIEDCHRHVIATFASREEAFEAVRLFVIEDRETALNKDIH